MATISVGQLDDRVVRCLEKRAANNNRSLESEVRSILEREANHIEDMETRRKEFIEQSRKFRQELADRPMGLPSWILIRQDRDEDHGHNW
ncbi:MAG: hypothetical protein OXC95_14500 [Dehalococcoidia bacterium]|nr:hypothetical protein [Dehalococcoidia bacterium]